MRETMFETPEELKTHIESWLKETNEPPVVYRWQWKQEDIQGAFSDKFY